jgi:hypothetical protein
VRELPDDLDGDSRQQTTIIEEHSDTDGWGVDRIRSWQAWYVMP